MSEMRLLVIGSDALYATAIRGVFAAQLPAAVSDTLDPLTVRARPVADAIVIDARADAARGAEFASKLRAMGFAGALVVVADVREELRLALSAAGAAATPPDALARSLVPCLAEQLELGKNEHAQQVMRARQLVAAGEIAMGFQHSLNNPLAGILAEAQLMQLDSMPAEQHAALDRIVVLCRRIIELGRSLDGLGHGK